MASSTTVFIAWLNTGGDGPQSKILGVYKSEQDAKRICLIDARSYMIQLGCEMYEYKEGREIHVDTFTWHVDEWEVC